MSPQAPLVLVALAGLVVVVPARPAAQRHATFRDPHAEQVFRAGRLALGGDPIERLRAFVMRGVARTSGEHGAQEERAVEIRVLLPDHCLRVETADGFERRIGFAGRTLLSEIRSGASVERPPDHLRESLLRTERFRLARLLLGSLLGTSSDLWLTFRWSARYAEMSRELLGTAVSVDTGAPPVLEVLGKDFFSRLYLNSQRVPVRLEYVAGERDATWIVFDDRRRVDGLLWPHRITTLSDHVMVDDLVLDEIVVNPPLRVEDFAKEAFYDLGR